MCWRHQLKLFLAAWGSLLDLTGQHYVRESRWVMAQSRQCPDCQTKIRRKYESKK